MNQAEQKGTAIADVDGTYIYRKFVSHTEAGEQVSLPGHPSPPLAGWNSVMIVPVTPPVTSGNIFFFYIK